MSGFRTLAPTVQAALFAAIASRLPATAMCSLGYPAGGLSDQQVWVVGDFDSQVAWATTGWTQRGEEGSTEVRVAVLQTTATFTDPQAQALVLAGCVEDAIAADHTLGGVVDRAEVAAIKGQEAIPDEHQRQYGVTLTVSWAGEVAA
jgi:hypothetical protein